ncbi:CHAT domain-containing protein [Micromonospora taraxaci]|uniref:CHAT domain-containing protein n=1 Tax=Micromonospora taraxaci TaxID=1316803 RepID=UPI0033FF5845
MVSFLVSYRADDSVVARLIEDALTARFGAGTVLGSRPSSTGLRGRLATAAALIVVIGPRRPDTPDGSADDLPDVISREIATAVDLRIPLVPVLVDDAEPPRESDLPDALRPLLRQRYRRVRLREAHRDLRRLVDELAGEFGAAPPAARWAPPPIPGPVRWPLLHDTDGRGAEDAPLTRQGPVEVPDHDPPRWPDVAARRSTRYDVDTTIRSAALVLRLAARDSPHYFEASIRVRFRVADPAEVVRHAITDAVAHVRESLRDAIEPIAARYAVDDSGAAEVAIGHRLTRLDLVYGGIRLDYLELRLGTRSDSSGLWTRWRQLPGLRRSARTRPDPPLTAERQAPTPSAKPPLTVADVTRQSERLLVARAPAQVPAGRDLSVDVRIVSDRRSIHSDAEISPMPNLIVSADGTPVTVTVHAPAGLHAEGPLQQTVLVVPHGDPNPIRFGFGARTPGLHRIDVTAWAGGTFLAEVSVEVSVAASGPFRAGQPRVALLDAPQARPGEVTMEVRFDGSRHTFQLRSDAALFAPVVESVTNTPNAAVENTIRELQQLAGGGSRYSPAMTREVIRSAGIQLWSELVPADVRDQFWEVGADMSAFTIATDHDVVPWELLYPLSAQRDEGFLVEQVPVVRRTYGQHRNAKIGLRNPRFVVPPKAPTGAYEEVTTIRAILGAADSEPITRADELLALINSGELGATHFACHNTFSSDGSFIDLDGGRFKPALLAEASVRKVLTETGPLVFINACRSAGVAPTYTRMLGWAQQFMSSGAGAFVGTLWAVRSDSSARFATEFYESLAGGATLGAAALAARVGQQDDPLDPTWLAYTVYGDPFATAAV